MNVLTRSTIKHRNTLIDKLKTLVPPDLMPEILASLTFVIDLSFEAGRIREQDGISAANLKERIKQTTEGLVEINTAILHLEISLMTAGSHQSTDEIRGMLEDHRDHKISLMKKLESLSSEAANGPEVNDAAAQRTRFAKARRFSNALIVVSTAISENEAAKLIFTNQRTLENLQANIDALTAEKDRLLRMIAKL